MLALSIDPAETRPPTLHSLNVEVLLLQAAELKIATTVWDDKAEIDNVFWRDGWLEASSWEVLPILLKNKIQY